MSEVVFADAECESWKMGQQRSVGVEGNLRVRISMHVMFVLMGDSSTVTWLISDPSGKAMLGQSEKCELE